MNGFPRISPIFPPNFPPCFPPIELRYKNMWKCIPGLVGGWWDCRKYWRMMTGGVWMTKKIPPWKSSGMAKLLARESATPHPGPSPALAALLMALRALIIPPLF